MEQEGIVFKVNTMVGNEVSAKEIASTFDAVCIAIGSEVPRDLPIEGRNLKGVHFALELLSQQNRILEGIVIRLKTSSTAKARKSSSSVAATREATASGQPIATKPLT